MAAHYQSKIAAKMAADADRRSALGSFGDLGPGPSRRRNGGASVSICRMSPPCAPTGLSAFASSYAFIATDRPVILFDFHSSAHLSDHLPLIDEVRAATSFFYFAAGNGSADAAGR